jgi:hypothetical protein
MSGITDQTFAQFKAAIAAENELRKANTVTTSTGLVAYDLQAPAKNLYPVNTPILATLPRVGGGTGKATNWRQVTAITGSGYDAMGWVPEGQRAGAMSLTEADKLATYVTIGEEEAVTFEAEGAARGFEDILATSAMRLLQKMRLKEEHAVLGGNTGLALGTTGTPTLSASGSGTLANATYSVIVVAMTYEGYNNWKAAGSSLTTGLVQTTTVTGQDGATFTLNGGYAQKSANATQATTGTQNLNASVAVVTGAVAYAWYVGTVGSEKLERVTTLNSTVFSAPLAGTGQAASALTAADRSRNTTVPAFDGLLYAAWASGSGAYINTLATGTAGTGTVLTSSGRGSVVEIDTMLQTMWDNYQVSPTVIFVNSQQQKDITNRVLGNSSSAPLVRFNGDSKEPYAMVANNVVRAYFNPFATNGGYEIPIRVHPTLPAGTIFGWCDNLPIQYQSNNVPNVAEVKTRKDYYQIVWPLVTRSHQTGVYAEEVLAVYFPPAIGIINNIAPG